MNYNEMGSIKRVDFSSLFKHLLRQVNQLKCLNAGLFGILLMASVSQIYSQSILDTTFNPNVNGGVNAIAVQPDGKILVGGNFTTVAGQTRNRIARLNVDGSLDSAFNPNLNNSVNEIAVQPDGKVLIINGAKSVSTILVCFPGLLW